MKALQLKSLLDSTSNKLLLDTLDISVSGTSAAQANISCILNGDMLVGNIEVKAFAFDAFIMYGDVSTTAPFTLSETLDLASLASTDQTVVISEINKFLNNIQYSLLVNVHKAESFLDEEYDLINRLYPGFDILSFDFYDIVNKPYISIESTDDSTMTAFGFISEIMYFIANNIIPKVLFNAVCKINPESKLKTFTHFALHTY